MNVNDPGGYDKELPQEEARLKKAAGIDPEAESGEYDPDEATIPRADYENIQDWKIHRKANADNKSHTLADHLQFLRVSSKRATIPLSEMDRTDFNRYIIEELDEKRGYTVGTINCYKSSLKQFFRWLGREWAEDIEFADADRDPPPSEDLFDMKEINCILDHGDTRGKAITALYADTGWRLSAIASLRVGDVDMDGEVASISINEDAHVKGAEGGTPLSFSRGYVASYLDEHPRSDDDDAPLIYKKKHVGENDDGALCVKRIRDIVKDMAEDAGLDRERVDVHIFRHSAAKRLKRQGVSERIAKQRFKWTEASDMWNWYGDETEEEEIEDQAVEMGMIDRADIEDSPDDPGDETKDCTICETTLPADARHCHRCGQALTPEAAEGAGPGDIQDPEETAEDLADMDGVLDEMGTAAVLERLLQQNPGLLDDLDLAD
jgi:integrase